MTFFKKNSIFSFLLSLLEKILIYQSKKIIVLMKGGVNYYTKKGVNKNKVFHLPNGVDIEGLKFQPLKNKVKNDPFTWAPEASKQSFDIFSHNIF